MSLCPGHVARRLRQLVRLCVQLLRQSGRRARLLRRLRADGAVRTRQRRRRRAHETPRGSMS